MVDKNTGHCLCSGIEYEAKGLLRPIVYCHCEQCHRTSGNFVAATACDLKDLALTKNESLGWYRSSQIAQRGFCTNCGSNLFWNPEHDNYICIMAGTLDRPTGLKAERHIFVPDLSDYYAIGDGLPQHADDGPMTP